MAPVFAPQRRYLRSVTLPRSSGWPGAFCCKWDGFANGWKWAYRIENQYWSTPTPISDPKRVDRVGSCPGVYVFLTSARYVLYIGKAESLSSRIWRSRESFPERQRQAVKYYAVCRAMSRVDALKMERALIYYYAPPWNRAIGHKLPVRAVEDLGEMAGTVASIIPSPTGGSPECSVCHRIYPPGSVFCNKCEVAL